MSILSGLNALKIVITHLKRGTETAFSAKYLFFTNVSLSLTLSSLGDVLEQNYEMYTNRIENWNGIRTRNMAVSGLSVGVVCHHWYRFLDKLMPGYTVKIVLKKVVMDQFIGSPLYIFAFFATIGYMEGESFEEFKRELRMKYLKLYAAEWMIWPPAQFINFYFLPTKYRVLFDNTVSLVYDIFTSHIKFKEPSNVQKS